MLWYAVLRRADRENRSPCVPKTYISFSSALATRAVREYQLATDSIEHAGTSPDPDALEKAMERFEKATAGMDRVEGWDAETFALQARSGLFLLDLPGP